ncbi:MAG TPA: endonuclease MutS2 [Candidatus Merdicola faecigallinarum]|uniref:Endonuclease MutS2 n=1 Tax=Candidatus Merdicola faecigallinarum TaxID=2840862 RepID=A0A9D1S8L1_9FIRM|nr:endonuclease MutS2 [Candidatus Merdicola faecigallinarum]
MNKYLKKLEYDLVLNQLSTYCKTYIGKDICFHLLPNSSFEFVSQKLKETDESIRIRYQKGRAPICELPTIDIWIKQILSHTCLTAKAILQFSLLLKIARELKDYFFEDEQIDLSAYPILSNFFDQLYLNRNLEQTIHSIIIDENTISDSASSSLSHIRRSIRNIEQEIKDKLSQFIHSSHSKYLQENLITIRNDRYVIPVKEEYRTQIKGFIHDISSSGSTIFIEPISIFELNNKLNQLRAEENIEIEKILFHLTSLLEPYIEQFQNNLHIIGMLDFIFAKAEYAIFLDGIIPKLNQEKMICFNKARHPLIAKDKVVPIDITLGKSFSSLVITGPNTGGKTVTLKTVGLLTLMAMSGLAIPAQENSSVFIFDYVFADIGDEQSIQESLSTFSSHMLNIVDIIKHATNSSLVLVDELGSGTDPIEGSSLAISILEYLYEHKTLTIATTHYPEIKYYALTQEGFENASQEFDLELLKPTYRLLIGVPGKSNAFAISQKLGLQEHILKRANDFMDHSTFQIEDLLKSIYDDKQKIEQEKEKIETTQKEIQQLKHKLEEDYSDKLEKEKQKIENAKIEARNILTDAKELVSKTIREVNLAKEHSSFKDLEHIRNQLNDSIKSSSNPLPLPESTTSINEQDIKLGMQVYIQPFHQEGIILSLPNRDHMVQVQIGLIKTTVKVKDITFSKSKPVKEVSSYHSKRKASSFKSKNISNKINVIGQTIEEANFLIDKFLDDCVMAKLETAEIVHGKGTGKLREGIHQFLKHHPHVKAFRVGTFGEGEMGVTIVTLK